MSDQFTAVGRRRRPDPLSVGTELPTWTVVPELTQPVRYAGVPGDFHPLHYDPEFAASIGYQGLPVQGLLKSAWLGRLVTGWLRPGDRLTALEASYRGMDVRGRTVVCGGRVVSAGAGHAELELWTERDGGPRVTVGAATIALAAKRRLAAKRHLGGARNCAGDPATS